MTVGKDVKEMYRQMLLFRRFLCAVVTAFAIKFIVSPMTSLLIEEC